MSFGIRLLVMLMIGTSKFFTRPANSSCSLRRRELHKTERPSPLSASRHQMVKEETLMRRVGELDAAIAADKQQSPCTSLPRWMAKAAGHPIAATRSLSAGRRTNAAIAGRKPARRACKRQDPKKIVVSTSDPDAVASRDKYHVFRPLYNVQLLRDVDSQFIMAYQVYNRNHDSGRLVPLIERCLELAGLKPKAVLVDSSYLSVLDLLACERLGITPYGPIGSNDYSEANERQPQTNNKTKLPKRRFTWLPEEHAYVCPKNHRLEWVKQGTIERHGQQQLRTQVFQCAAEICAACSLRLRCTPKSKAGRTITRIEHEELAETLRARMAAPEAKKIYKLRGQTIEHPFADVKENRERAPILPPRPTNGASPNGGLGTLPQPACTAARQMHHRVSNPDH